MSDKEVERNVRSTTVEGIRTPTERHTHGISEQHSVSFGEKSEARKTRQGLLDKFRSREMKGKNKGSKGPVERKADEPGEGRGGAPQEQDLHRD
jgi:hypothetical protein